MSRAENNKEYLEKKTMFFDEMDILTSRPEGMKVDEYKAIRRSQKKMIKLYLKGEITFLSKLFRTPEVMAKFGLTMASTPKEVYMASQQKGNEAAMLLLKGRTYER